MSTLDGVGSQFPASAGSSSGTFLALDSVDLPLMIKLRIQAQLAYNEYQMQGDLNTLDDCIKSTRLILEMTEDSSPEKAATIANLSLSLYARYESAGEPRDLKEAISLRQLADALTPAESPDKHRMLCDLATSLKSRFEREGRSEDLEEAINLGTRAIELVSDDHAEKPALLNNLGNSLWTRFSKLLGTPDDLDKAILFQSRAVTLTSGSDPNKPTRLMNLGNSLRERFGQLGNLEDLERAIKLHSRAADLVRDGYPHKAVYLNNAGSSLLVRFRRLGNVDDLSQAIQFQSRAVETSLDTHPLKPGWLSNLAASLQSRYERTRNNRDLEQAVAHQTRAVALIPDGHLDKAALLNNLGNTLQTLFKQSERLEDLDAAIAHNTKAVTLTPEGHHDQQGRLYNLANSLEARFIRVGDVTDLAEAIRCSARSVELLPENHPNRAAMLRFYGRLIVTRLRSPHAHADDATRAMEALSAAMRHPTSPPRERLWASRAYADLLTDPRELLEAYQNALNLVPQCVWVGNNVRGRYPSEELYAVRTNVDDAVAAAISVGEYGRALEWLETGRSIVWSQVLQLHTPVDDLRQVHPQLASHFLRLSQALQQAASTPSGARPINLSSNSGLHSSHSYALEYGKLITQIRELKGFENFMQPKKLSQLAKACAGGPVVVINMHESRCDALVLHGTGAVVHVPLPDFSLNKAWGLQTLMWNFLKSSHLLHRWRGGDTEDELEIEDRGAIPRRSARIIPDLMRRLLYTLWVQLVKPIMDVVCTLVPNVPLPHITWCPTGPLSFLPLHAAGIYPKDESDMTALQTIMDIAVSSYTPTLEALLKPRAKAAANSDFPKVLIVSQPNTPGCNPISGTTTEAGVVMSLLDMSATTPLHDTEGTVNAVLEGMATHSWVHLACHGVQDSDDPLNSAFRLYNGRLTLETLMTKHLSHADLAVLSACQTATGDERLSDEVVHLAAGMLNIGYKSVIGTMWSIFDSSAPNVMGTFYEVMAEQVKEGGELQPAYALHEATKALRMKYGVTDFVRWIPFVHFGL